MFQVIVFSWIVYSMGVVLCLYQSMHLMSVLIGLEMAALGVYSCMSLISYSNGFCLFLLIMVMSVVEVSILLSLVSSLSRVYGHERTSALMMDKS